MSNHSMSIVEVRCDAVHVGDRHRRDLGEIESLAESIATEGLLQPIGITEENVLVFGERRLRAVQDVLRRETISARVVHVRSITAGEYAENQIRKDFTPSERVAIGKALEAEAGDRRGQRTDLQIPEHLPALAPTSISRQLVTDLAQVEPGVKTRVIVAKAAGFRSASTYGQAKKVVAQGAPDLVAAMDSGEVSISAAAVIAAEPRARQEQIVQLPGELRREIVRELREAANLPTPGDAGRSAREAGASAAVTRGIQAAAETESTPGQMESTSKDLKSTNRKGRDSRADDAARTCRAPEAQQAPASSAPVRATRSQRIDRLARLTLSFIEATKHLAHLVGWLGETAGKFDEAELLLSNASNAIAAVSAEIERTALAADPLNASRLGIQEKTS